MEAGTIVFGSPEANRIAEQTKLLSRCKVVTCPECEGLGTKIVWDRCDCCRGKREKEVKCWQCDGKGQVLRDPSGSYYYYSYSIFEREIHEWPKLPSSSL